VTSSARPQKAAILLARRIVQDVVREGHLPGTLLPPEKQMLQHYEIGRSTLREALRLLEFQGLITLKPGPGGGPVVQRPDAKHLTTTLILLLQVSEAPFRVIIEARSALEPMIARLAAERISGEDLQTLAGTIDQMNAALDDQYAFLEANKTFHYTIAHASGNTVFAYIVESLLGILDGTVLGFDLSGRRNRQIIAEAHESIFRALEARDPDTARAMMEKHIRAYASYAKRTHPDLLDSVPAWERSLG
jgi:GntR family transcriptional regulator, transcriptional repressor for pyruvate dehydrogenase complex